MTTRTISLLRRSSAAIALAIAACGNPTSGTPPIDDDHPQLPPGQKLDWSTDSIIVKWKAAPLSASSTQSALARVRGTIVDNNKDGIYDRFSSIGKGELAVIDLAKGVTPDEAIALLAGDPTVAYAERNWVVKAIATPNDPRFGELYGMHNTGQTGGTADADIDAPEAWDNSVGSSSIVVGVIDTGIDYNHEDLAANAWVNPNEIAGNGIDDDANGVIDDVHGFNAITNTGDPLDDHDHGSHVSGTIGAVGGNGIGVVGVNWEVQIMGMKFLDAGGSGTTDGAIASVNYAVMMRNAGVNLRVLSNSWGGGGFSQALADAIESANGAGMLFVAAAGNAGSDNDTTPHYPSSYENANVLSVAATDDNDGLASFSNFGATSVDMGAPGVDILSTTRNNTYQSFSGTSMATPHVAGVAALVLSANDTLTVEELKAALMTSGDTIPALAQTVSGRRLNAANALDEAGPPVPRFNMSASPPSVVITQGESASYGLDITSVAGFTGDVAITVTSNPAIDATITVTPPVVTAPGSATVAVATTTATSTGIYTLTITGTSGALTKSRTVSLRVRAEGTVDVPFPSSDTPIAIPDNNPTGITSTINVQQPIQIEEVQVQLDITHTFIGDLVVTLTSPTGTTVTLHNRTGGGTDNIHQLYTLPVEFIGESAQGDWTLNVADLAGVDVGTLDSWVLHIIGVPGAATFGVDATPASRSIAQGASTTYDVAVSSFGGFTGDVALTVESSPALNGTASFNPATVTAPGASVLTVATNCDTAPGTYTLTITGSSGGVTVTDTVTLIVTPFGTSEGTFPSTDTPISIPDNNPAGITSNLVVADSFPITALTAEVNITHTFIGDLTVTLTGPNGTAVVLHNRTGGGTDNLHQTYPVTGFDGVNVAGTWQLTVTDSAGADVGTLDSWTLRATGAPSDFPPNASFTYTGTALTFQFTDTSSDGGCSGGAVVGWAWDFGDGTTSTEQNPTHTYAAAGTYTVTLTVTDAGGLTGTTSQQVTATRSNPTLQLTGVTRNRPKFEFVFGFAWSGAQTALVDFYRNNLLFDIPDNDGVQSYRFRSYETAYSFKLCEQQTDFCSNVVSVDFGPNPMTATQAAVTVGNATTMVPIIDEE
ncbi:MAG: S8 family serine peptidase [Kofleriaceae bacterium]